MKLIPHLATRFTVRPVPRIVLNKLWFLSTDSSSPSARARYTKYKGIYNVNILI